jgi:hypothetical protein
MLTVTGLLATALADANTGVMVEGVSDYSLVRTLI